MLNHRKQDKKTTTKKKTRPASWNHTEHKSEHQHVIVLGKRQSLGKMLIGLQRFVCSCVCMCQIPVKSKTKLGFRRMFLRYEKSHSVKLYQRKHTLTTWPGLHRTTASPPLVAPQSWCNGSSPCRNKTGHSGYHSGPSLQFWASFLLSPERLKEC